MTQVIINLTARYAAAFGASALNEYLNKALVNKRADSNYEFNVYPAPDEDFEDISFAFDDTKITFGSIPFVSSGSNSNVLAPPPIVNFSSIKKHIETDVNGGPDEVTEYWKTGQFLFRMRGILIDLENHYYPENQITELNSLYQFNNVVEVIGTQFLDKSITHCYFKEIQINPVRGYTDTIQYVLTGKSKRPANFTLNDPI